MAKYVVYYSGFAYVEADNMDEAVENYEYDDCVYRENQINDVEEVSEFTVGFCN